MADNVDMYKAREMYYSIISYLDNNDWKYERFDDDLVIKSGVKGDDLPIEFIIVVKPKNQIIQLLSKLPFDFPRERIVEGAYAVCAVNNKIVDGSFDYDIDDGSIMFRLTSSYRDSYIGEELFEYMILVSCSTIDGYNDSLYMYSKGLIDLAQFLNKVS